VSKLTFAIDQRLDDYRNDVSRSPSLNAFSHENSRSQAFSLIKETTANAPIEQPQIALPGDRDDKAVDTTVAITM
jgi:hypothetical protein